MITYYPCAHNQWLCIACHGVERVYLASFHNVSRGLCGHMKLGCGISAATITIGRGKKNSSSSLNRPRTTFRTLDCTNRPVG